MPDQELVIAESLYARVICNGVAHWGESKTDGTRYWLRHCDCKSKETTK